MEFGSIDPIYHQGIRAICIVIVVLVFRLLPNVSVLKLKNALSVISVEVGYDHSLFQTSNLLYRDDHGNPLYLDNQVAPLLVNPHSWPISIMIVVMIDALLENLLVIEPKYLSFIEAVESSAIRL